MNAVEGRQARVSVAVLIALAAHVAAIGLAIVLLRPRPPAVARATGAPVQSDGRLVWLAVPGPGGGGGGGGNQQPAPPRPIERPGDDRVTVAAVPPVPVTPASVDTVEPPPDLNALSIPVQSLASGMDVLPGQVDAPQAAAGLALGPGRDAGAGTGLGGGDGPGRGSGLGPGDGGGTDRGYVRAGSGVSEPVPIVIAEPRFTSAAMQARLQGDVVVECIVQPDGVCNPVRVIRSLDSRFGLDDQALEAARRWRFKPGMRLGEPVPVLVNIVLEFRLR